MIRAQKTGYSFVEVLVAIAILLVGIVGPLTIASKGLKNATFAREQNVAFFLAQEGIEGVLYLREAAGLAHLADGNAPTWDWVTNDLPSECFAGSPCKIDIDTHTVSVCDPISECDLYLFDTGTIRYRYDATGEPTLYNRALYFTAVGGTAINVRSVVSWNASAFQADRSVELGTYIYDIYGN